MSACETISLSRNILPMRLAELILTVNPNLSSVNSIQLNNLASA